MAEENIIFEMMIEKRVLGELLNEKEYQNITNLEEKCKLMKNEINNLKTTIDYKDNEIRQLIDDNLLLKKQVKDLEIFKELVHKRQIGEDLKGSENEILRLKIKKIQEEKEKLLKTLEEESKLFEKYLHDNTKLRIMENELRKTAELLYNTKAELKKSSKFLKQREQELMQINEEKLKMEKFARELNEKNLILHKKASVYHLENTESTLLKLKLQRIEKEKQYLAQDFEREMKITKKENLLRKGLEQLLKNVGKTERSEEVANLKVKIEELKQQRKDLIEGFEQERFVFRKIMLNMAH